MQLQFNRKFAALLSLAVLFPTFAWLVKDNYKLAIITKESVAAYGLWQTDQEIAVVLETVDNRTIGLSHWSEDLKDATPFFFEPYEVSQVFSCHPELLDAEIQDKHMFREESGVLYTISI